MDIGAGITWLTTEIGAILTAPFAGQLDLTQLFLIVGAVLIIAVVWAMIFQYIEVTVAEV